ncbi:hypothetical protein XU06_06065 [Rhodococcus erythropolis]|nr:hypothetical protein XU06_06065 [Rhodococcus erythropolis]
MPTRYWSIVVNIKRQLPPASEIGSCLNVARALEPADVFDQSELRMLIEQMHIRSTSVVFFLPSVFVAVFFGQNP